jgi:Phosphofructokinase
LRACLESLRKLGIGALVTIGGDDTAFSASRLAEAAGGDLRVAHVPKTIDNDLPLPRGAPTFGFETARSVGVGLVNNLMTDAITTQRWYLVVAMGRSAGHLALGIGKSAGATLAVIAEEFPRDEPIRLSHLVDVLETSMLKRIAHGWTVRTSRIRTSSVRSQRPQGSRPGPSATGTVSRRGLSPGRRAARTPSGGNADEEDHPDDAGVRRRLHLRHQPASRVIQRAWRSLPGCRYRRRPARLQVTT